MKALLVIIMLGAIGILWFDDNSKRSDLQQAQAAADTAAQQVQQLTAQVTQLQAQLNTVVSNPSSPYTPSGQRPAGAPAAPPPAWFQQRVNGERGVLDPSATPGR